MVLAKVQWTLIYVNAVIHSNLHEMARPFRSVLVIGVFPVRLGSVTAWRPLRVIRLAFVVCRRLRGRVRQKRRSHLASSVLAAVEVAVVRSSLCSCLPSWPQGVAAPGIHGESSAFLLLC